MKTARIFYPQPLVFVNTLVVNASHYEKIKNKFRPSQAKLTNQKKTRRKTLQLLQTCKLVH
jgi:hypothetical protein